MQTTRKFILEFIQANPDCTISDIAIACRTTKVNIQYHLKKLDNDQLIQTVDNQALKFPIPGRPSRRYRINLSRTPHNCVILAQYLLEYLNKYQVDGSCLEFIADKFAPYSLSGSLTSILNQTISILREMNYEPLWEARLSGPTIFLRNCPYAAIRLQHPELCKLDLLIIKKITQKDVQIQMLQNPITKNPSACEFKIIDFRS